MDTLLNFNVGVLGHIDSGKTTLSKTLSEVASTASFDKNPQSQERGISLDLGFSSFSVPFPDHLKNDSNNYKTLQFTLVDCPGHASLLRTIIGGAQIIDFMLLVVDATKGIQTQTAECLVIGEITCEHMIIVINKIDLLPEGNRLSSIAKMSKKINKTLEKTKFSNCPMIPISAKPGNDGQALGINDLVAALVKYSHLPRRSSEGPFLFAVDHCFAMKGQGSVLTGTVIQGCVSVSSSIEIPTVNLVKKVKSIQMFRAPIEKAIQGDRVGICISQKFDPKLLERGVACTPGYMKFSDAAIAIVEKIVYFKGNCLTGSKFHISMLHENAIAKCLFFESLNAIDTSKQEDNSNTEEFDFSAEYPYLTELKGKDFVLSDNKSASKNTQYVLLEFDRSIIMNNGAIVIGSRLDMDIHSNACRLAFCGKIVTMFSNKQNYAKELCNLNVYKLKSKEGTAERIVNNNEIICTDLFKKETNIDVFVNLKVTLSTGEVGTIAGSFGQSGKVKVYFPNGLSTECCELIGTKKKKKEETANATVKVLLTFKRYMYGERKRIVQ